MTELEEIPKGQEEASIKILNAFLDKVQALAEAQGIQITATVTNNDLAVCMEAEAQQLVAYMYGRSACEARQEIGSPHRLSQGVMLQEILQAALRAFAVSSSLAQGQA